jgi:hypothetical protein
MVDLKKGAVWNKEGYLNRSNYSAGDIWAFSWLGMRQKSEVNSILRKFTQINVNLISLKTSKKAHLALRPEKRRLRKVA